jgi:hypothetical protein
VRQKGQIEISRAGVDISRAEIAIPPFSAEIGREGGDIDGG